MRVFVRFTVACLVLLVLPARAGAELRQIDLAVRGMD